MNFQSRQQLVDQKGCQLCLSHDLCVFFKYNKDIQGGELFGLDMIWPCMAQYFFAKPHYHQLVMTLFKSIGSGRCTCETPPSNSLVMVAINRF